MRGLNKRLVALEEAVAPLPEPVTVHLVGMIDGGSEAESIAAYEAECGKRVEPGNKIIFLCGVEPPMRG